MWVIRPLEDADSRDEITALLHRAYAPLREQGFHFVATDQSVETTIERLSRGHALVAVAEGEIVGTISFHPAREGLCLTYDLPGTWSFGQFAVAPELQGQGLGQALIAMAERGAATGGADCMACDTAEGATHLIAFYERLGYRLVDRIDWPTTNYLSEVLAKGLSA